MTRDVVFSRAVRSSIAQSGKGQLEQEIPLPGMAHLESQIVAPLVAHGELLGILCIQSDEAGRFLVDNERVTQIVGRHLAASMAMLRSRHSQHPAADLRREQSLPAFRNSESISGTGNCRPAPRWFPAQHRTARK